MAQGSLRYRLAFVVAIASMAVLGGWLGALAADREQPVVIYSAEAMTTTVAPGSDLRVQYHLVRRRSCDVTIDRFVYDRFKTRFELPDTTVKAGMPLGEDHYVVPVKVPEEAEPGAAVYRTVTSYACNPLQKIWPIVGGVRDIQFIIR